MLLQWLTTFGLRIKALFKRRQLDRDLEDELNFHLAMRAARQVESGTTAGDAHYAAQRRFGNTALLKEETRDMWTFTRLESVVQDVRYAGRGFRRNPVFTITAVFAIALGIGATTAVFSVVDRILFRLPPYPHADRLVSVGFRAPIVSGGEFMLGTDYLEWRAAQKPFEAFTSWSGIESCDLTGPTPLRLSCARVESTFLPTFGIQPILGRNFSRAEDQPKAPKVALLSYGLWQSRFGRSRNVLGKSISLDSDATRIIGVLPRAFELPNLDHADLVVPQKLDEASQHRPNTGRVIRAFARLKSGISIPQARAALEPLFDESLKWVPPHFRREVTLGIESLQNFQVEDVRLASWIFLAAVIAVLLIACANVASLLLARAIARRQEIAVRSALGARRSRLIRQSLTESVILALAGGASGCVLADLLLYVFTAIAPHGIPRLEEARIDSHALLFAFAASAICGIVFGLVPALQYPGAEALAGGRILGFTRHRLRQGLVSMQIAVSLVLLAGAGLLLRSLWKLEHEPLGMDASRVLTVDINLDGQWRSNPAAQLAFFNRVETRLKSLPGVDEVALTDSLPPGGWMHAMTYAAIEVEGRPRFEKGTGGMVAWRAVTPAYFSALRIAIRRGRPFVEQDRAPDQHVIILSEDLARRLFPGQNPLDHQLRLGLQGPWYQVVGVAANVKNGGLSRHPDPEYYVVRGHAPMNSTRFASVVLRTAGNPSALAPSVRHAIAQLDPDLPVTIETMKARIGTFAVQPRFDAVLLSLFAAMGALLAAIGIYGIISFLVIQRTQEIGVRMALGATRTDILWLFVLKSLTMIGFGAAIGLIGAFATSRMLATMLYGVKPDDPLAFFAAFGALVAIALVATYFPARRSTRVDPMVALRHD